MVILGTVILDPFSRKREGKRSVNKMNDNDNILAGKVDFLLHAPESYLKSLLHLADSLESEVSAKGMKVNYSNLIREYVDDTKSVLRRGRERMMVEYIFGVMSTKYIIESPSKDIANLAMVAFLQTSAPIAVYSHGYMIDPKELINEGTEIEAEICDMVREAIRTIKEVQLSREEDVKP